MRSRTESAAARGRRAGFPASATWPLSPRRLRRYRVPGAAGPSRQGLDQYGQSDRLLLGAETGHRPTTISRLYLRTTPGPYQRTSANVTRIGFEAVVRQLGLILDDSPFDLDSHRPGAGPARFAGPSAGGLRGLFLMPARVSDEEMRRDERLLAACRAAGLPVVLIERNLRGTGRPLEYDLVGLDDVGGAAQLTRHLLSRRRKRIALVVASPISTHDDRMAGYLAALYAAGPDKYQPLVLHERTDVQRRAAYARLADQLIAAKADGGGLLQRLHGHRPGVGVVRPRPAGAAGSGSRRFRRPADRQPVRDRHHDVHAAGRGIGPAGGAGHGGPDRRARLPRRFGSSSPGG